MLAMVRAGSGSPSAFTPCRPAIWRSHSNGAPSASSAANTQSTISGPMPSPGMSVAGIFCVIARNLTRTRARGVSVVPLGERSAQLFAHGNEVDVLAVAEIVTHVLRADVAARRVEPHAGERRHQLGA